MRLDKVYIDGFKNLKEFEIDFAEDRLTAVIIGQNGTGKSNLIEAIATVFRDVDLNRSTRFIYKILYRINGRSIRVTNREGRSVVEVDGATISRREFDNNKDMYFPALVFGYYSGTGRRLEKVFDEHQKRYYDEIIKEGDSSFYERVARDRRLFYSRNIHGSFALMVLQAFVNSEIPAFLEDKLRITEFHSALAVLKEPSWFKSKSSGRGRRSHAELERQAEGLWGASGLAGDCVLSLKEIAFLPFGLKGSVLDDYRKARREEPQLGCFLPDLVKLREFASRYSSEQELFNALEAVDISDLIRDLHIWIARRNEVDEIEYSDLSDGERQLLMVLGLIRISRGRNALFLLDEPDTHLNPVWQHTYLDLIHEWSGIASDERGFHIVMTSHNPLTIAGLKREEVHVMYEDRQTGETKAEMPVVDPRGLGVAGVLRQIFGMRTTLDPETQKLIDERNRLVAAEKQTPGIEAELRKINAKLDAIGLAYQSRDPDFDAFLKAKYQIRSNEAPILSPDELEKQAEFIREFIGKLN